MSIQSPKICAYVYRQGQGAAGTRCSGTVTPLDPQKAYCCRHYKIKCVQPKTTPVNLEDQIAELREELEALKKLVRERATASACHSDCECDHECDH